MFDFQFLSFAQTSRQNFGERLGDRNSATPERSVAAEFRASEADAPP
jgi:hypothetical protein